MRKIQTQGVHHITINGANRQTSIDFWEGVLGMPFVFEQPNLDNASESHLYFDPGDGRLITVFTNEDRLPDPETFHAAFGSLAAFHDQLWERTGIDPADTVFGGFSMGSVMSYSMGLGGDRPKPAGILAFSGFIPIVDGWQPDLASRADLPVFIAHGRRDPIMEIDFARRAKALLEAGGLSVEYHESDAGHEIDPSHLRAATDWLAGITATARKGQ